MPLRMTCTARQSAKQAQAKVRSLATRLTASVTSLNVVPAASMLRQMSKADMHINVVPAASMLGQMSKITMHIYAVPAASMLSQMSKAAMRINEFQCVPLCTLSVVPAASVLSQMFKAEMRISESIGCVNLHVIGLMTASIIIAVRLLLFGMIYSRCGSSGTQDDMPRL